MAIWSIATTRAPSTRLLQSMKVPARSRSSRQTTRATRSIPLFSFQGETERSMRHMDLSLGGRVRAALIGGVVAMLVATSSLAAPVLAADQAAQVDAIGPHTHQIHGVVKGTPGSGVTSFVMTTERYGDVNVSFTGATVKSHGRGHARSFEVAHA